MAKKDIEKKWLSPNDMVDVNTWEDALAFMQEAGVNVYDISTVEGLLGDGYIYVEKNALVNVPFLIMAYADRMSTTYNVPFVTVWAMTATNKRVKFTDFGSGSAEELRNLAEHGRDPVGMICQKGLVANEFDVCSNCNAAVSRCECETPGEKFKATAYRLGM